MVQENSISSKMQLVKPRSASDDVYSPEKFRISDFDRQEFSTSTTFLNNFLEKASFRFLATVFTHPRIFLSPATDSDVSILRNANVYNHRRQSCSMPASTMTVHPAIQDHNYS